MQLYRVRHDLTWDDVLRKSKTMEVHPKPIKRVVERKGNTNSLTLNNSSDPGYWTDVHNCRKFFDQFAASRGFDPRVPGNWYSITWREIHNAKVANVVAQIIH